MTKYRIIGNMTGNSMDAIDLVLTEFDDDGTMQDICRFSKPYDKDMQQRVESLRTRSFNRTGKEIEALPDFQDVHDDYIRQIAACINEICHLNGIDKSSIDAIGFHGKTLDHNPPSKAKFDGSAPYTLQMGSGQMLADLTGITVVYDFRSDFIMSGFEGAPLVAPHNARISSLEGDGCYYNGGNTSNFAIIRGGKAILSADSGPFNEYTDNYIRHHTQDMFDKDGCYGYDGKLDKELLQKLFDFGRSYYETKLPKSGDPAYYHKDDIFAYVAAQNIKFADVVHTFEYFAAYIAAQGLTLVPDEVDIPSNFVLFGGGWKNPIVYNSFASLLQGKAFVLEEHKEHFAKLCSRFTNPPQIFTSRFGDYMEARLFADLAYHKLTDKPWVLPETEAAGHNIVCGVVAYPGQNLPHDYLCRAAKGWQQKQ